MIDVGLVAHAKKAVDAKPRRYVTAAHVVAVALQESNGVPYFNPFDAQFRANMRVACKVTGMSEGNIRKLIIIPSEVNGWKVPGVLVDKFAKFRLEPGYWNRFRNYDQPDRFYRSCSWGMGQLMGAHLEDTGAIRRFLCDVPLQALWVAGMMEDLLIRSKGDLKRAYAGYNSGDIDSDDPDVLHRAQQVENHFLRARIQIGG